MSNRDDFSRKTKTALALRASYRCSFTGCNRPTVGPSDESKSAVNIVGVAAHICAAAPTGRRYDATMTPEQRASIENGIWMCTTHGDLIDGDDVRYTVPVLHHMKAEHEARCVAELARQDANPASADALVAIGPNVVALCSLVGVEAAEWSFHLKHFVLGDMPTLAAFLGDTGKSKDAYVLSNVLGDGRVLAAPPSLKLDTTGALLRCPLEPHFPRIDGRTLPRDFALSPSNDLKLEKCDIATVSGLDALPQRIRNVLSVQRGEMFFHREFGTRLGEYYHLLLGSPWFQHFLKLEVIRQASIPRVDTVQERSYTPLLCVDRVHAVKTLAEQPVNHWLPIRVELEVKDVGRWSHDVAIFIPD